MNIKPGDRAPEFTLYSTDKSKKCLSDYKGKNLVILFFPLAFSGISTIELCSISEDKVMYDNLDTDVIGISVDSIATLAKFKEIENLNMTLLSDFNKEVCRAYGALYDEFILGMKGVAKRSAFVIDREGLIKYAEVSEHAAKIPDFDAVKQTLAELN